IVIDPFAQSARSRASIPGWTSSDIKSAIPLIGGGAPYWLCFTRCFSWRERMAKRGPSTLERDEKEKETARVQQGTRSASDSRGRGGNGGGDSPPTGASEPPPGLSHTEFYARVARRAYDLFE